MCGIEVIIYRLEILYQWDAVLLTVAISILVTLALTLDYDASYEVPWRGHWVQGEFRKSSLMIVGSLLAGVGLVMMVVSFTVGLNGALIDYGAGVSLVCAGGYMYSRFSCTFRRAPPKLLGGLEVRRNH